MQLPKTIKDWFLPRAIAVDEAPVVRPGLYHFMREVEGSQIRYHLRVDDGGPAILIAAASEALLLSPVGAAAAKALLEGKSPAETENLLPASNAAQVVEDLRHALDDLGQWDVRYPIFNLVDPALYHRQWQLSAPFQADVVVGNDDALRQITDRLWAARVPHVRFIVTPRTGTQSIVNAVRYAEDIGMIAGVRLPSAAWLDHDSLKSLADVGVDYLMMPWGVTESLHHRWYGQGDLQHFRQLVGQCLSLEVTPVAFTALVRETWEQFPQQLDAVISLGVGHMEVFAVADEAAGEAPDSVAGFAGGELRQLAGWIEDLADKRQVQLVWLPPAFRSKHRSIDDIVRRSPRTGGDVTIRVEADGSVLAPRGPYAIAGNMIEDDWETIWNDERFQQFRLSSERPSRCSECSDMTVCASFCPADADGWVFL